MHPKSISISRIINKARCNQENTHFAVCWIKEEVDCIEINHIQYKNVSNTILFLDSKSQWKVFRKEGSTAAGYILQLSTEILNSPQFKNLHINKVRLFNSGEIPLFKLSPGIEKRTQAILEMIDELLGSQLNHKDDAILSLLNTFFIYCDGQCNIRSIVSNNNTKAQLVYQFKQLVDKHLHENHEVSSYATMLNISPKYLNECVKDVLSNSAKQIIVEQLLMRSRYFLKFSSKTIKKSVSN